MKTSLFMVTRWNAKRGSGVDYSDSFQFEKHGVCELINEFLFLSHEDELFPVLFALFPVLFVKILQL